MIETVSSAAAWFLAWLFVLASWHKLRSPAAFAPLIQRQLPRALGLNGKSAAAFAVALGVLELLTGAALLIPETREAGAILAISLLLLYALSMSRLLLAGVRSTRCGCGGLSSTLTHSWALVARNIVCAALAGTVLASAASNMPLAGGTLLAGGLAALLVSLYLCIEQLISNAQQMQAAR